MAATARQRIAECVASMHAEGLIETAEQKDGLVRAFEEELATVGAPAPEWYFDIGIPALPGFPLPSEGIGIDKTFRATFNVDPYAHSLAAWKDVQAGVVGTKLIWPDGQSIEVLDRSTAIAQGHDTEGDKQAPPEHKYVRFVFHDTTGVLVPHPKIARGLDLQIACTVRRGARFADA